MADHVGTFRPAGNVFQGVKLYDKVGTLRADETAPAAGVVVTSTNRVYDTAASGFVRWDTTTGPDSAGASYPGPGTFGVDTSDYCVERVF